jgi:hypothetical protein
MKAGAGPWVRDLPLSWLGDQDEIPLADLIEETADIGVGHAHAAMRAGAAQQRFVIGAVNINVALKRIPAGPAVYTVFLSVESENAREDQIVVTRCAGPDLTGQLPRHKYGASLGVIADALLDPMPAWRRAVGALLAADARSRRRHRPRRDQLPVRDQNRALALHIHHEETRRQRRRRALTRQSGARQLQGACGQSWVWMLAHGPHSATAKRGEQASISKTSPSGGRGRSASNNTSLAFPAQAREYSWAACCLGCHRRPPG